MNWNTESLGKILIESKIPATNPNPDKRIRVKLNVLGVEKRPLENEIKGATKQYIRKAGQFIYGKQNFHKGAFGVIPNELDNFESSADLPSFDVREDCSPEWIYYFFKIGNRYRELEKFARGVGSKRIHPEQIYDIQIPFPSFPEQTTLLQKFKELEHKGSELQKQLEYQIYLLSKLSQQILQDAIQGKLVPQDPKDEPASVLLEKIKAEKEKLIKEGKLKKQKTLPPIKEEEIPFAIPKNWTWVRLGNVCNSILDGTHFSPTNSQSGKFKYITAKNIKESGIDLTNVTYISKEAHENIYSKCNPEKGDLLFIKDGATTGVVTINNLSEQFSLLSSVALLKIPQFIDNKYFMYAMRSPYYYNSTRNDMYGVAITRVTLIKIQNSMLPIPPIEEQKRIVKKVKELLKICDELEQEITQSQYFSQQLLQSALKEALEPKGN